ncbi:MAG: hypothetical protein ACP5G7_10590 [Anaerolineae bacterium]
MNPSLRKIVRFPLPLLILCTLALIALNGCSSGTLPSPHGYVLARYGTGSLRTLPANDPLYQVFDRDVMSDPVVAHLLSLFDGTCGGFDATNLVSPNPQTLSNYLVIVIGAHGNRLLKDIKMQDGGRTVQIEYAVALSIESDADLSETRGHLRELLAQFLLAVTGQDPPAIPADVSSDCTCAAEAQVFWRGYAILQRDRGALGLEPGSGASIDQDVLLSNLGADDWACCPTQPPIGSSSDCICARGVAGFLAELVATMPASYPQRYMLWFANYEPGETRDAKLLLAFARMSRDDAGLDAFVTSYADTFPSEADLVRNLSKSWRARMAGADR